MALTHATEKSLFDDLEFSQLASDSMFTYMRNAVVHKIWPRGSKNLDQDMVNYACMEALNGVVKRIGARDVTDIGWVTENAIIKGTNRMIAKTLPSAKVSTDQIRSILNVALTDGLIERDTVSYLLRPGPSTFFRLSASYFGQLISIEPYEYS